MVKKMQKVEINFDDCINCKICVSICPMGVYEEGDDKIRIVTEDDCIVCRGCEAACPTEVITISE
jgi:NAD-dependent dihydropyrimidine dehydrogenase PreA subunit